MVAWDLSLLIVGSVATLALLLGLWQMSVSKKLRREIGKLKQQLASSERDQSTSPHNPVKTVRSFSASLNQVERQQVPAANSSGSADKYRYAASLASQGVDAEGIAAALQMAPAEVEQLLQLARIKQ